MLDLKYVRSNLDSIKEMINNRGYDLDLTRFETLDRERREGLTVLEELRHRRNRVSEEIAAMKKKGEDFSAVTVAETINERPKKRKQKKASKSE